MAKRPYRPASQNTYVDSLRDYLSSRQSRLTNFNPGSRLLTFLEAIGFVLSQGDVNTLSGFQYAIREGVFSTFGFSRNPGLRSTGIFRIFNEGHTSPVPIPKFKIDLFGLEFETVGDTEIPVGQTTVEVEAIAALPGAEYNIKANELDTSDGLGTINISLPTGARVWNPFDFNGGTEVESEESREKRFQSFILSLGRSTILGIYNAVVSIPGIAGAQVETNINPITRLPELNWINIYVSDGTSNPPESLLDLVRKTIVGDLSDPSNFPGYAAAGTSVYVGNIPVLGIVVDYELEILSSSRLTTSDAIGIANSALVNFLNTLPVGFDILIQQMESAILKANFDFYRVNIKVAYGRRVSALAPEFGEWLPGNVFNATSNTVPVLLPLPSPIDVTVQNNELPRVGGTSGGSVNGTATKVDPL